MDFLKILNTENRVKISNILFYAALFVELVLMIVEKSELSVPFESYVFRGTFAVTLLAVLLLPHSKKEWFIIAAVIGFTFICYRISGKNELLRFAVFVMAARDIDLRKTMKAIFFISSAGFLIIVLLSCFNVFGRLREGADYGRNIGWEMRYMFGFGHPNTFWSAVFVIMLLWIWLYGAKAKWYSYAFLVALNILMYKLTVSRTAFVIGVFTCIIGIAARYIKNISGKKVIYILTLIVTPVFCVAFSTWAAYISYIPRYESDKPFAHQIDLIDDLLTNRIHNLYRANERHAGAFCSWKLFSDRLSEEYFDMGWVRLFYWYGIIPTILISLLVVLFIYICYKKKDVWTLIIILSVSIYTIIEATFVSVYIGRNFILPILGVYLGDYLEKRENVIKG